MTDLANKLQRLQNTSPHDDDDGETRTPRESNNTSFNARVSEAQARQKSLVARYEALRRKAGKASTAKKPLSLKEKQWISEIDDLSTHIDIPDSEHDREPTTNSVPTLTQRFETLKSLSSTLLSQHKDMEREPSVNGSGTNTPTSAAERLRSTGVASRMQRERMAEVMEMVEREGAIIEATNRRLGRLMVR